MRSDTRGGVRPRRRNVRILDSELVGAVKGRLRRLRLTRPSLDTWLHLTRQGRKVSLPDEMDGFWGLRYVYVREEALESSVGRGSCSPTPFRRPATSRQSPTITEALFPARVSPPQSPTTVLVYHPSYDVTGSRPSPGWDDSPREGVGVRKGVSKGSSVGTAINGSTTLWSGVGLQSVLQSTTNAQRLIPPPTSSLSSHPLRDP